MSSRLIKIAAAGVVVVALALAGGAWAIAGGGDDEGTVTGPGADRAKAAALAHLGGGKANAVERDDEDGATWEVEVTKADGSTVDVRLDAAYQVVGTDGDSEEKDQNENENENESGSDK